MPALPVQKPITSCSASSEFDSGYTCENVFALTNEWAIAHSNNGAATVGSWIQLNFIAPQLVNTLKFAQRAGSSTGVDPRGRDLRVDFSDGSTTVVTVADDTRLHSFPLPVTTTIFVKLTRAAARRVYDTSSYAEDQHKMAECVIDQKTIETRATTHGPQARTTHPKVRKYSESLDGSVPRFACLLVRGLA
jgi:hypothetical protein